MKIEKQAGHTLYLGDTSVENIFINEYMPEAPGDFVKVYLACLMYGERNEEISPAEIAKGLMCSEEDVEKALEYWRKAGIMRKTGEGVKILSLKEQLYGNSHKGDMGESDSSRKLMNDQRVAKMFDAIEQYTKEYIQPGQMQTILGWITDYDTNCDVIEGAYKYCAEIGKTNLRYVDAVVRSWAGKGIHTPEEIEEHLANMDRRHAVYKRVMRALGFSRNATEAEREIIGSWVDELSCSMEEILEACAKTSGIPNPNVNYVDSVLRNRKTSINKGATVNKIMEYYSKLREKASEDAANRRREVYAYVPRIEQIDMDLKDSNFELTKTLMSGGNSQAVREKISALSEERDRLLTENNIPIDYMNIKPRCRICGDTGITKEGARCQCYEEVAQLAADA